MKLSNKILIAAFSLIIILTFITMVKIKGISEEYRQNQTLGNKNWVTAEFPLQEFTELKVGDHFKVNWHKGVPMVKVHIEENIKSYFKVDQDGSKVNIHFDSLTSYRINGEIVVDVYSQSLNQIHLHDFVRFTGLDTILTSKLKIEMEDHCEAEFFINVESMELNQFDFCQLEVKGSAKDAQIKLSDHCQLGAEQLNIWTAVVDMDDFTEASILVRNRLKADCNDHSNLEYKGDSVLAEITQRDFSEVSKGK